MPLPITILQSADQIRYARLLFLSSQTTQTYCSLHDISYELTLGIRYGSKPWHAALNRITILKEYLDRGYDGWVVYIDADAYIVDLDFDLRGYLVAHGHAALIAARSGVMPARWWDINNGVFAINLAHPAGRELISLWFARLHSVPESVLATEQRWGDIADDQEMLHSVLQQVTGMEAALVHDEHPHVLNWEGSFIAQRVRESGPFAQRVDHLAERIGRVLNGRDALPRSITSGAGYSAGRDAANEEFVQALYSVLLRRAPDPEGLAGVVGSLKLGNTTFQNELRNCIMCDEFRDKLDGFIAAYLPQLVPS